MPFDPNVRIESGGATFMVATDAVRFQGDTAHFQLMKLAFGPTGSANFVSSTTGLPVNVIAGGITASLVGFCGAIQGIPGGNPVEISGTVYATGICSAPVYVRTSSGYQVEVTGGRSLNRTTDNISVFGPSGVTWIYSNIVDTTGTQLGTVSNPFYTNIIGATINASINPTVGVCNSSSNPLFVIGVSGATAIPVTIGNTAIGIDDGDLLNGITALYSKLNDVYTALSVFGLVRPSGTTAGILSNITTATLQLTTSGFTCTSGINLKAASTNTDLIYVGNNSITTNFGFMLDPGEQLFFNIDNMSKIYIRSKSGTQMLSYIAS